MKSPSQSSFPHGRPALIAATVAILFGASTALAQAGGAGATSAGSSQKNPGTDTSSSSTSSESGYKSQSSQSGTTNPAAGSTYHSGTAGADVDSTKEINAQINTQSTATGAGAATGRETTSNKLGWMDRRFVNKAADNGMAEVQIAQLAAERASNAEVKSFAQKLVDDHSKVNDELKGIASQKNVKLDDDSDKDRAYKRLAKKSGLEFDQEFVEHMIDEHEKDVKLFEKAAKDAKDADLRAFAAKHVDHLREHLRQAESLRASVMPTGRTDTSIERADRATTDDANATGTSTRSSTSGSYDTSGASTSTDTDSTSGARSGTSSSSDDTTNSSTTPKRDGSR